MIAIDRCVRGVCDVSKPHGPGIVEQQRHLLRKRWMIVLQGSDIIRPLVCHGLRNLFLAPHGIHRDDRPGDVEETEQRGHGGHCIRLLLDFQLPQHQAVRPGPGTHPMDGRRRSGLITGMAQRFPIKGDDLAARSRTERIRLRDAALGQLLGGHVR